MTSSARSPRKWAGRALGAFGVVCLAGAAALVVVAAGSGDADEPVLEVETVVAEATPDTIAPILVDDEMLDETEPPTDPDAADDAPDDGVSVDEALASGDPDLLAEVFEEELGDRGTAIPEPVTARARPVTLRIDTLRLEDPVRGVGLEPNGEMEVPDETEIGWYRYGAAPGLPGATVLAAHVSWNDTTGPFFRLGTLEIGDQAVVTLDDGTVRTYEVVERTMYLKDELPRERIWRNTGDETLVLITCGGDFNRDIRRYAHNIVVYAVPIASGVAPEQVD